VFKTIAPELPAEYVEKLEKARYLGVVCVALLLKRGLSPFYVTNLVDPALPFTGVIEMTALVSRDETAGRHLVYVPHYTVPDDPYFDLSDAEVWKDVRAGLMRMHPDLKDEEIEKLFVFREKYVQPIPTLNYSRNMPSTNTGVEGLYLANSTFLENKNLSNNEMVRIARRAVDAVMQSVEPAASPAPLRLARERLASDVAV
jgi:protoporphyrinogen oxidase